KSLKLSPVTLTISAQNQRVKKLVKVSENQGNYNVETSTSTELELIKLRAVGQVNKTYIVAEHSHGLWLVEQHIAHERVLYERLQDEWQLITIEQPIILTQLSMGQVEQLKRIGLEVEPFGEQIWAVRTVPKILEKRDDCPAALIELSLGGDLETAQVATACRSAIRNGMPLDLNQMQDLLDTWKKTRNPRTCPHGRPIYLSLEESSLSRFFRRNWVIGKSHGI
ncbi:MAG: DNA mismatch repair protein MutL, partial [Crocosphaera sp.]